MIHVFCSLILLQQHTATADAPAKLAIAGADEPGQRLLVSGVVQDAENGGDIVAASVFVYHTDDSGNYSQDGQDRSNLKLSGGMRTDSNGAFQYDTIRPGRYPDTTIPKHIHYIVRAEGYKTRHFELVFDDDPHVTDAMRARSKTGMGGYDVQRLIESDSGQWTCHQVIKMTRS